MRETFAVYGFITRRLPGGPFVRTALATTLAVVAGLLLWYLVFPALDALWFTDDSTVRRESP